MNQEQKKTTTEQIWRELNNRLRQFVRSRITSIADVDDVLQSVFLSIHTRLDDLRNVDRLESWVFQITRNAVTDHFRKTRDAQNDVDSLVDDSDDTNAENVNSELAGCLGTMIERLPEDQRQSLSMYELQHMSQKEIATQESISLSGVKSRIQRGRKTLKALLKACCEFQLDGRGNVVEYKTIDPNCCDEQCR